MQNLNYRNFVSEARAAARDIIRSRKVSDLLRFIRTQEAIIKNTKKGRTELEERQASYIEESKKTLERAAYNFRHAEETGNPDVESYKACYEETKKEHEEFVEAQTKKNERELEDYDARAEEKTNAAEAKIEEYNEKIANWQNGTSKVDFSEMEELANSLMSKRVTDAFVQGEYDGDSDVAEDDAATA